MVKSACGIEAVYMCFNGTGIWGGETLYRYCMLIGIYVARMSREGVVNVICCNPREDVVPSSEMNGPGP